MTARLPVVAGDSNAWGSILNTFLSVAHNADGTLKNLFVNVADYGASPTAIASVNDTAFANAIAALPSNGPGVLFFPCVGTGIYNISQSMVIDKDNIVLLAFGHRGTVTIQIDPSADPTWALIVGNTKNVSSCLIEGLTFVGRNSTSSTGGGMLFRSNLGKIRQTKVALFGKKGISIIAFSGTIFEVYGEDINLVQNGMNSGAHDDNLVIDSSVSDCEYHRVISEGDATKSTTHNGITNNGGQQKFIDCHAYQCSSDGFFNNGQGTQIIGGEYESNAGNGIESFSPLAMIDSVACFGNTFNDIVLGDKASVKGCSLTSSGVNVYSTSTNGGIIADNMCGGATALYMDTGSSKFSIHDNTIAASSTAIYLKATNSQIHDNICTGAGTIVEDTGANGNDIHNNRVPSAIAIIGTTTKVRDNPGYNPRGFSVTQPAVPASTVALTNTTGVDCNVLIKGGTLTVVNVGGSATGITAAAAAGSVHSVRVPAGQTISITYTVAPTWTWFGD